MVQDLMKTRLDWDFIYFGRRRNKGGNPEFFVSGHTHLSTISYSYWTIGYAISLSGAKKLIEADPLNNLLTLDEFLPIMYSQHPNQIWSRFFEDKEKLNAFAVYPLILEPERYSFHSDFLSDTEGSEQVDFNYLSSRGEENNGGEKKNFLDNEFRDVDVEIDGKLLRLKRVIATGGFSQIYLAEEASNNEKFAIKKILCHGQDEIKCVRREIELLTCFSHLPHILPFLGVAEGRSVDPTFAEFCMVFPFCRRGSLQEDLANRRQTKQFFERKVLLEFFRQISEAIEYLHSAKPAIAHRPYRAPELFTCEVGMEIDESVDIWSLGCVFYALCYFVSPFDELLK
uniref:Protein kinase domain-containing protein n=1 Tax=Meloidogyne javanica TaxID=6303 RepID=A0A915MG29_MELJA